MCIMSLMTDAKKVYDLAQSSTSDSSELRNVMNLINKGCVGEPWRWETITLSNLPTRESTCFGREDPIGTIEFLNTSSLMMFMLVCESLELSITFLSVNK